MNRASDPLKNPAIMAVLLAAGTFILFAPALGYSSINYDDDLYLYNNPPILGGFNWSSLTYAFTTTTGGSWMPLTWLSYLIDITLFGDHAAGFHLTNLCLHAASVSFLFLALHALTGNFWRSVFVAAVFGWHPLRSESVVWIAERKDTLSTLCCMLGLLAYARAYRRSGNGRSPWVLLWLLLGLMAKPMLVTFPFVLLLLDLWPLGRAGKDWREWWARFPALVGEKIPLFLLCVVAAGMTYWSQRQAGAVSTILITPAQKLMRVSEDYGFYLGKVLWPANLSIIYPTYPLVPWHACLLGLLLALVTVLTLKWLFRFSWLPVGWFWFLGTLVPVVGVVRVGHITVADRYTYLPAIGLTIAAAWTAGWVVQQHARLRLTLTVAGMLVLANYAVATRLDLPRWRDSTTLFSSALRVGNNEVTYNNLTASLNASGDYGKAIQVATMAIRLYPEESNLYENRGVSYNNQRDYDEAIEDFTTCLRFDPDSADAYNNRGTAHVYKHELAIAIGDFTSALQHDPKHASAWNNRGSARSQMKDFAGAIADCTQAIQLNPLLPDGYNNRAITLAKIGQLDRAVADYGQAIQLDPMRPSYYNNRAAALCDMKQFALARSDLETCRRLGGQPPAGLVEAVENGLKGETR